VDGLYGVDFDGDVDIERAGDNEKQDDEEEEDEEEGEEEEEEEEDKDDGKEPRMIGPELMVDNQLIMLSVQGQEMCGHTPRPQSAAPTPCMETLQPRPRPRTAETHPLSGRDILGLVPQQRHRPAVPTVREAEAARNTSHVDVDKELVGELAGGDSLPDVPLPDVHLLNAGSDGSVGKE